MFHSNDAFPSLPCNPPRLGRKTEMASLLGLADLLVARVVVVLVVLLLPPVLPRRSVLVINDGGRRVDLREHPVLLV